MQMKNKIKIIEYIFLFISFISNLNADEFNIVANEIIVDKENKIITGIGSVQASDADGKIVKANKITYEKEKEFLLAEGEVIIADTDGNILKSDKATYDKINEIITTYEKTKLALKEGYKLETMNVLYNVKDKILSSNDLSKFQDNDGNIVAKKVINSEKKEIINIFVKFISEGIWLKKYISSGKSFILNIELIKTLISSI